MPAAVPIGPNHVVAYKVKLCEWFVMLDGQLCVLYAYESGENFTDEVLDNISEYDIVTMW